MSTFAIMMLIIAVTIVWGGLVAAIVFIRRYPDVVDGPFEDPDLVHEDEVRAGLPHPTRDT